MAKFTVSTDSTADLYADYILANDVRVVPLMFTLEKDGDLREYSDTFQTYGEYVHFYRMLRDKYVPKTVLLNYEAHMAHFRRLAEEGIREVLHLTLSSGLSGTCGMARDAAEDMKKEYPDFRCIVMDSLAATIGQGEVVYEAVRLRDAGYTLEEAYEAVKDLPLHIQYVISADDLHFLNRGGRVGKMTAVFGTALQIKPIMTFTQDGKLAVNGKVRRMKGVIEFALAKMDRYKPVEEGRMIHIVHTDAESDAAELARRVEEKWGFAPEVSIMGPVIGTHIGPGGVSMIWKTAELRTE